MDKLEKGLEKLLIESKPLKCELCGEKMYYQDSGKYKCHACDHIMLDDFGKVKQYIETHGPSPAIVISNGTGVRQEVINMFLRKGRVEIPEGSKYYIDCKKCGCSIRYGRYCPDCIRETAHGIKAIFNEDLGERPKKNPNPELAGKMHFLNKKWK